MNGNEIALDTSEAIAVLNNTRDSGAWIVGFRPVYLPAPVVGELWYGALNSRHATENVRRVDQLISRCRVLSIDAETCGFYARTRLHLKRVGTPIPENDIWIAALCLQHGLPLATVDDHFRSVEGLTVVSR